VNETRHADVLPVLGHRFPVVRRDVHRGAERTWVRCPLCDREMLADTAHEHVEKHVAREERGSARAALRELGASPPLPGQLGLPIGGRR
jgi:hypothetical protein